VPLPPSLKPPPPTPYRGLGRVVSLLVPGLGLGTRRILMAGCAALSRPTGFYNHIEMENFKKKWPAIAFQGIFLALDTSFLLHGSYNKYIVASLTLIIFLFTVQIFSNNPRFMYLFPVNLIINKPTPSIDTWILKIILIISIFLFYVGATNSLIWALTLIVIVISFLFIWDRYLEPYNQKKIEEILKN
jgi:hypothetical protein